MKAIQLSVMLIMLGFVPVQVHSQIRDSLLYLTAGLQVDRNVSISSLQGVNKTREGNFQASQGYKFVKLAPTGPRTQIRDSLFYLVPDGFRSRTFSGESVATRNGKAAVLVLSCTHKGVQLANNGKTLVPNRGCQFKPYQAGTGLRGRYILIIPEY